MKVIEFFNSVLLYVLVFILSISYVEEFVFGNAPCPLCILQRFFMVGIGVPLTFNISRSIHFKNFSLSLLSCVLGAIVSLYQWSQLLINDGISNATKIFSLPMYIWAALLFFGVSLLLFFILFFMKNGKSIDFNWFIKISYWLFFLMTFSQVVTTFYTCGVFCF